MQLPTTKVKVLSQIPAVPNESGCTHIFGDEIGLEGLKWAQLNSFALIVLKAFHAYNSRTFEFSTEIVCYTDQSSPLLLTPFSLPTEKMDVCVHTHFFRFFSSLVQRNRKKIIR